MTEMDKAANITNHVSNELRVSALGDGAYDLFFQVDGNSSIIGVRVRSITTGQFLYNYFFCEKLDKLS